LEENYWPPVKGQTVRVRSMYQTGVVLEVRDPGAAATYVVALRTIGSVGAAGEVRWQPIPPRTCGIDDLEPFASRH
jgi:hypothetical protein